MLTFGKGQPALLPESEVTVRFSCTKVDARLRLSPNLNTGVRHYRPSECALGGECPGLPSLVDLRLQATEQLVDVRLQATAATNTTRRLVVGYKSVNSRSLRRSG